MLNLDDWESRAIDWLSAHRRRVTATLVAALAGFSAVAFGIAPLAPDAARLPQQVITEELPLQGLDEQLNALAALDLTLNRSEVTRGSDTAESLLTRLGVSDPVAALFLRQDPVGRAVLQGRGGKLVQVRSDAQGRLIELVARYAIDKRELAGTHFTRLTMVRFEDRWHARTEPVAMSSRIRLAGGTIRTSLFAATDEAGIPDAIGSQLAEIFSTELDFHRQLRRGDTFSVVYEALTADDEPVPWNVGAGRVLAAEFVNLGRVYHAVWFDNPGGRSGYFDINGQSKRRSFLASPMEFSRVTSGFAMRFHPILQRWRAHLGVDYGAPIGTPVRSIGDGLVTFAGWQNGYGNVVEIEHGNARSTLYAHLSRMEVRKGQRIQQGQQVGAVGMTGWTTGPHLHFEFRVNGQHQDPLIMARAAEPVTLDLQAKARFEGFARSFKVKLDIAESMAGARPTFE